MPVRDTRYRELGYEQHGYFWRVVDKMRGGQVGPHYRSLAELLCDLDRFAREYGADTRPPLDLKEGMKVWVKGEVTGFSPRGGIVLRVDDLDFGSATVHAPYCACSACLCSACLILSLARCLRCSALFALMACRCFRWAISFR